MTDPQNKEIPTLEDELFDLAPDGRAVGGRAEPIIRTPSSPPWELFAKLDRRDVVRGAAGFMTFTFIDFVMMYGRLTGHNRASVLPQTVTLLVLAFGLGGLLAWHVRGAWRPYGFGMMLGWVALTLLSAGWLTGVIR
ncbi:hypothetical protein SAMN04489712_111211 [Thermomonospora echinospora]|uniref:Uncharacterized protein n=1 Tax=Thermomonospora echinospora TaxID=1992 RepID=A0A1H6CVV1_9ACTN|nr:hypothetical protein [Thermomonospora echinospora]SEG76823.1 hypothetical protein SAMN04489712_111211 [Thermomonospora echinospora]